MKYLLPLFIVVFCVPAVMAQTSSLHATPTTRMESDKPLLMSQASFIANEINPPKTFKEQDMIKVIVRDQFKNNNTADSERKRKMNSSYGITNMIKFSGFSFLPSSMEAGSPTIAGEVDSQFKNKGKINHKESTEFIISCRIVTILDNGLLYVKGTNTKNVGQDDITVDLSGFVREEDVSPGNSVKSEDVGELSINVRQAGAVYDSNKLNWGQKFIDRWSPF